MNKLAFGAVILMICTSCANVKDKIGFNDSPPNEFGAVSMPALTIPPDFGLKPSAEIIAAKQKESYVTQNKATDIFGGQIYNAPINSNDQEFLEKIGAEKARPNIRQEIDMQNEEQKKKQPWFSKILGSK